MRFNLKNPSWVYDPEGTLKKFKKELREIQKKYKKYFGTEGYIPIKEILGE